MKNKSNPEFSEERETRVLLEDLNSQFKVFGEGMQDMRKDIHHVQKDLTDVKHRLERVEIKVTSIDNRVGNLESRVGNIETFLEKAIPTIATKDDLKQFEKRLVTLETSR